MADGNVNDISCKVSVIPLFEAKLPETPISRLSPDYDGGANELFIKRDDLLPFSFGGNKVRKAAEFYQEIQKITPDVIMTYGSAASNHCRVIANMAKAMGLSCHLITPEEEADLRPHYNRQLTEALGATVETCAVERVADTIKEREQAFISEGKTPYFIQGGGHGSLGTAGYVKCYREIMQQAKQEGRTFDYIFHASGTGATQAGLICGRLLNMESGGPDIIGISIARPAMRGKNVVKESIQAYLGERFADLFHEEALTFIDDSVLGGYGKYNEQVLKAIDQLLHKDGIYADTTYVGKAFYGMQQYIEKHSIAGKKILFIHTGSTPLFFDGLIPGIDFLDKGNYTNQLREQAPELFKLKGGII